MSEKSKPKANLESKRGSGSPAPVGGFSGSSNNWPAACEENRPWTRWWWFGSAVDPAGLTRALEELAGAGIGGVEICPIYGAKGAEDRYLDFLSKPWLEALAHTCAEAERLGMGVDLTTGTGWPFGGPVVSEEHASTAVRLEEAALKAGETLEGKVPLSGLAGLVAVTGDGRKVNLLSEVERGPLDWRAPEGGARVFALVGAGPVQKVKRAAPGGEGWVLNPFSSKAMDLYLSVFDAALEGMEGPMPRGHFHDSFEYFGANWTPDLAGEFLERRGYDLREYIPELSGFGDPETVARVRCDYREVLSELHLAYIRRWTEWAHEKGGVSRNQAHGTPGNIIDVYAAADIPETEIFGDPNAGLEPMLKFASGAAHIMGGNLASSESFTWQTEHFQASFGELKRGADLMFLSGINHVFFHGIPYSPPEAPWPGWLFYASVHMGREGGLWRDLPAFCGYLTRCQSILQDGRADCDVLLYFPVYDFWQKVGDELLPWFKTPGKWMWEHPFYAAAVDLRNGGRDYDPISDRFLQEATFRDGKVCLGGGEYKAVVVPPTRVMTPETARALAGLASAGAMVVFQGDLPVDVPGLKDVESRKRELASVWAEIPFEQLDEAGLERARTGEGFMIRALDLETALNAAGLVPEPMSASGLKWVRRRHGNGSDYFIVNPGDEPFEGWIELKRPFSLAILLDPADPERCGTAAEKRENGASKVYLQLAAGESLVLRARESRTDDMGTEDIPGWSYLAPAGEGTELAGTWNVTFLSGGPELPENFTTESLGSWTDSDDPEAKRFCGTAMYAIEFRHNKASGEDWFLDLGDVAESARVTLNGRDLGCWWSPPFRRPVGMCLVDGVNRLEIEVTNLAANRIADMDRRGEEWKRFHEINFVNRDYRPFDASGWPVRASGLIGPVRLTPARRLQPE